VEGARHFRDAGPAAAKGRATDVKNGTLATVERVKPDGPLNQPAI
jgi:hypothetical protein